MYLISNIEEIFKINEDRTIGDKLPKKDIDIIKKSIEDLLKDKWLWLKGRFLDVDLGWKIFLKW